MGLADRTKRRPGRAFRRSREDWTFSLRTSAIRVSRGAAPYIGATRLGDTADIRGAIPGDWFTLSIQAMPPGNRIPISLA